MPDAPPDPTDAALLHRAAADGDRAALDTLVRRHVHFVYGVARRQMRGDAHAADDVTQAVFLVLAAKAKSVTPSRLGGWLFRTTCYAAANARKATTRRVYHERRAAAVEPVMPPDADPLLPLLDDALDTLGAADREAIVLRYLQGRDMAAVSTALGTSEDATRRRVSRAIEKLRRAFAARGVTSATTPGVMALVTAIAAERAPAAVLFDASAAATGSVPATAAAVSISKGVFVMLLWSKVKVVAGVVFTLSLMGVVGLEFSRRAPAADPPPQPAAEHASFTGTLANGVSVELIGVGENPSAGKPWWQPDGSALAEAPYAKMGGTSSPDAGRVMREFAFRPTPTVRGSADAATIDWSVVDGSGTAGGTATTADGKAVPGMVGLASNPPDRPATLRFQIAAGAWEQDAATGPSGTLAGGVGNRPYVIDASRADPDGSFIAIVSLGGDFLQRDVRLVAMMRDGGTLTAESAGGARAGSLRQQTWRFSHARAPDIQQLRLESRAFDQWIEFRNITLHAGQATHVEIVTSDNAAGAFEGEWRFARAESSGRITPPERLAEAHVTFKGNEMAFVSPGDTDHGPFTLDTTKSPHWIDSIMLDDRTGQPNSPALGLIEGRGNELWIVLNRGGGPERPTAFESKPSPSPNRTFWVLRRAEPTR